MQEGRVVIIGAGFGGLAAAKVLARENVPFLLIDKRNHHLFQPLLYQVATAALSPAEIAMPIRAMLSPGKGRSIEILMEEVVGIDTGRRIVRSEGGDEIPYGELIIATGSNFTYFGNADWPDHAPALKSLDDALNIRRRILLAFERAETTKDAGLRERLMTFVVIGGGPTGVETAGALAELARSTLARDFTNIDPRTARVVLVEALDTLLGAYPGHLGGYARRKLEELGVEVHTGAPVEHVDAEGVRTARDRFSTANVFWCAGVEATPVGEWLGVETERNGTVPVGSDLQVPGLEGVYVIGDAARCDKGDGTPLPALAPVAKQQGKYAARAIVRARKGEAPQDPFRYRDWGTMATIGRAAAVGKFGRLEVKGFPAWLLWGVVHVAYLVGFRNRLAVLINWLYHWITYEKGSRLITGPDQAAIKSLDSRHAVEAELDKTVNALREEE